MHNIFRNFIALQWCLYSTPPFNVLCALMCSMVTSSVFGSSTPPRCECCSCARKHNWWNDVQHLNQFYVYKISY